MRIEAEHNELVLRNSHGDTVVVPAEKRGWVKRKLRQGCHDCIDKLVATLPTVNRYAQDGTVIGAPKTFKGYQNIDPSKYETHLTPKQELAFQRWLEAQYQAGKIQKGDYQFYKQKGYGYDYDFRAAFLKGVKPQLNKEDKQWHWNDYGKKPNEPTFSDESKYHGVDGYIGGTWDEDNFSPPPQYEEKKPEDELTAQDGMVVSGDPGDEGPPGKPYGGWLDAVVVSTKTPDVALWSKDFLQNNDHQKFLDEQMRGHVERFYDPNVPDWARQVAGGYNDDRKAFDRAEDEKLFEQKRVNYIAKKLLERSPSPEDPYKTAGSFEKKKLGFKTAFTDENPDQRLDWLKKFSPAELAVLMRADDPAVMAAVRPTPMQDFRNVAKGSLQGAVGAQMTPVAGTTYEEQLNAFMNLGHSLTVPLSTPANAIIQMGDNDKNYSIKDVFQGRPSGAGFWKQTLNDPFTYAGMGLGKAGEVTAAIEKFTDAGLGFGRSGKIAEGVAAKSPELTAIQQTNDELTSWANTHDFSQKEAGFTYDFSDNRVSYQKPPAGWTGPEEEWWNKSYDEKLKWKEQNPSTPPDQGALPPAPPKQIAPWQQVGYYEPPPELVPKPWGEDKELDKIRQVYWQQERPLTDLEKKRLLAEGLGDTPSIGRLRDDYFNGSRELRPEEMKRLEEEGVKYMTPEQIEMLKSAGYNPITPAAEDASNMQVRSNVQLKPKEKDIPFGEMGKERNPLAGGRFHNEFVGNTLKPPGDYRVNKSVSELFPIDWRDRIRLSMQKKEGIGLKPYEWEAMLKSMTYKEREDFGKTFRSLNATVPAIATGAAAAATAVGSRMQKRKKTQ